MLPILYEDDDVVAIDKPEGLSSIPERDETRATALSLLEKQLKLKLFVVHRLDKDVSGCMLFAKTAAAHKHLNGEFQKRNVHKTYLALVHGTVARERGLINKPIRQFGSGRMGVDENGGKESITRFAVQRKLDAATLVAVHPVTGKRHQIRVHLYSIGHPVAGDRLYGDPRKQKKFPRLMLHAKSVQFTNSAGKEISVESASTAGFLKLAAV